MTEETPAMQPSPPTKPPFGPPSGQPPFGPPSASTPAQPTGTPPSVQNGSVGEPPAGTGTPQRADLPDSSGAIRVIVSWIVILSLAVGYVLLSKLRHEEPGGPVPDQPVSAVSEMTGRMMQSLDKLASDLGQPAAVNESTLTDSRPPDDAPYIDRVAFAILIAEVIEPAKGLDELDRLKVPDDISTSDEAVLDTVRTSLTEWAAGRPRPAIDDITAKRLGWYAKVLDGTAPPSRVILPVILLGLLLAGFGLAGVVLLITGGILAIIGSIRSSISLTGRGALYAETFAVWFTLFIAAQFGIGIALQLTGLDELGMLGAFIGMFLSLIALAWPVIRGAAWSDVRNDIGLHAGRGVIRETLIGPLVYASGLPLMFTGLVIYMVARSLVPGTEQASHPVVEQFGSGALGVLWIYLLACVAAPVVEEIAFRGILYRHLRESGRWVGGVASAALATIVSSVIFAGIHPQGLLFIPVLGGLATAFCFGREWRGSLIPCIVAHALNNAVTVTLGVSLASG